MFDNFFAKSLSFRIVIGFISAVLLSFLLFYILYAVAPTDNGLNGFQLLSRDVLDNNERICVLYVLSVETICIFLIPALILLWAIFRHPAKALYSQNSTAPILRKTPLIIAIVSIIIANIPGINLLSDINTQTILSVIGKDSPQWQNYLKAESLVENLMSNDLMIVNIICMAIIPAVCEEFFFRGFMQTIATNVFKNKHIAVVVTSIIFSILHGDIFNFIPRFVLGLFLGYLFLYTKNIWYPIIAHTLHNTMVVFCNTLPDLPEEFDTIGTIGNGLIMGIASVLLLIFVIYFLITRVKED